MIRLFTFAISLLFCCMASMGQTNESPPPIAPPQVEPPITTIDLTQPTPTLIEEEQTLSHGTDTPALPATKPAATPPEFKESTKEIVTLALGHPTSYLHMGISLTLGTFAVCLLLLKTQSAFNAYRSTLLISFICTLFGLAILACGMGALSSHIFPAMGEDLLATIHQTLKGLLARVGVIEYTLETSMLVLKITFAVLLLLLIICPFTFLLFKSGMFSSCVSWVIALTVAWILVEGVNLGFQTFDTTNRQIDKMEKKQTELDQVLQQTEK